MSTATPPLTSPPGHPGQEPAHHRTYHQIQLFYMISFDLGEYLRRVGIDAITRPMPVDQFGAIFSEENDGLYYLTYPDSAPDDPVLERQCYALLLHVPSGVAAPGENEGPRKLILLFQAPDSARPAAPPITHVILDPTPISFMGLTLDPYQTVMTIAPELLERFQERAAELLQLPALPVVGDARCVLCWEDLQADTVQYWTGDFFSPWSPDAHKAQVFESGDQGFMMARVLERCKTLLGFTQDSRVDFKLVAYTNVVVEINTSLLGYENREGLTIAQLKSIVANWPELDNSGAPLRVYLSAAHPNDLLCRAAPINLRVSEDNTRQWADLLLSSI